jgi:hypothetical protein
MKILSMGWKAPCLAIVLTGAVVSGQSPGRGVPPIPAWERFAQGAGLRITLTMKSRSLAPSEAPGFRASFHNTGTTTLNLNPNVVPNLRVFDESGALAPPGSVAQVQNIIDLPDANKLIRLRAGEVWSTPVEAAYTPGEPGVQMWYQDARGETFLLPSGRYSAVFTYVNFAGYFTGSRDLRSAGDVWEGRLDSEPITFSVAAGADDATRRIDPAEAARAERQRRAQEIEQGLASYTDKPCSGLALSEAWRRGRPASEQRIMEMGICGSAESFVPLRALVDSANKPTRALAASALRRLTFVGEWKSPELASPATPAGWDAWYQTHRRESRAEWAVHRLRDSTIHALQENAAMYLRQLNDPRWLPDLRRAAERHPSALARINAALAVADVDRAEGLALVRRELFHRYPWICQVAVAALNELTGRSELFDCLYPSDRERASELFIAPR